MTIDLDMTAERLIHYLEDPKQLRGISYQELKKWSDLYPFCQNLRYLVVQKSKMDQQKEYPKDLELAATYSIDRSLLHQQIELNQFKYTEPEDTLDLENDTLVLEDLSEIETIELEQVQATASTPPSDNFEFIIPDVAAAEPILDLTVNDILEVQETETEYHEEAPQESISNENELHDITVIERLLSDIPNENLVEDVRDQATIHTNEEIPQINLSDELETSFVEDDEEDNLIDLILNTTSDDAEDQVTEELALGEIAPKIVDENILPQEENISEIVIEQEVQNIEQITDQFPISNEVVIPEIEESIIEQEINSDDNDSTSKIEDTKPQPIPKRSFSSWLKNYQQTKSESSDDTSVDNNTVESIRIKKSKKKEDQKVDKRNKKIKKLIKANKKKSKVKKKKKTKPKATDFANKSIMDSEEIISQTLADLLAAQGYSDKAIKMYERLSLIFPEKSSFFANKIKELSYFNE